MTQKQPKLVDGGDYLIPQFYGLHTAVKNPKELALGQPQDSLNFITGYNTETKSADNIQLRTGSALLYKTRLGAGKVNALAVGQDTTGKQWVFFACGGQAYYYNPATGDLATVGNGTYSVTEDMTMEFYSDLFGPNMFSGSPNSGLNLISVANKQMVNFTENNVSGYLTLRQNFGWVWNYINQVTGLLNAQNLNQSNPDQTTVSISGISNPQGSTGIAGNGVLKAFTGTLANFSALAFTVQIGAPINSLPVSSFSIPAATPFSSALNYSVTYTGGFQFNAGDYVVVQGDISIDTGMNDCIGIVESINGTTQIAVNFINEPTLTNTSGGIATVIIANGGSGYTNGDILTLAGGSYGTVQVGVSGGVVTGVTLLTPGVGYTALTNEATTGGTGTGCIIGVQTVSSIVSSPGMTLSKVELFEDDGNGNLKSTLGSTGTVNYASGAFTINTQIAVPNGLNIDSINFSGIPGVITFAPGSWTQFGGVMQVPKWYDGQLYCFHTINTWVLNLEYGSSTSPNPGVGTQQMYRQNLGIPYFRAAYEKGEGILFLDDTLQNNPHLRILQFTDITSAVIPDDLSADMDFSGYDPSNCVVSNAGEINFLSLKSINNGVARSYNDTTFLRNTISGFWDKTDFRIAVMDIYNGAIVAGDTISQNIFQLFTGVDDDGAPINAYWTSGQMNLGFMGLKQFNLFHIDGFIGPNQVLNIYAQWDTGNYVLIGSVYGNGKYVDQNNSISIGQGIGGTQPIGGTGNGQVIGYYFTQDIPIWTPLFQYVSIKFVPSVNLQTNKPAFGALQINANFGFRDCRIKSVKAPAYTIGK